MEIIELHGPWGASPLLWLLRSRAEDPGAWKVGDAFQDESTGSFGYMDLTGSYWILLDVTGCKCCIVIQPRPDPEYETTHEGRTFDRCCVLLKECQHCLPFLVQSTRGLQPCWVRRLGNPMCEVPRCLHGSAACNWSNRSPLSKNGVPKNPLVYIMIHHGWWWLVICYDLNPAKTHHSTLQCNQCLSKLTSHQERSLASPEVHFNPSKIESKSIRIHYNPLKCKLESR